MSYILLNSADCWISENHGQKDLVLKIRVALNLDKLSRSVRRKGLVVCSFRNTTAKEMETVFKVRPGQHILTAIPPAYFLDCFVLFSHHTAV